MNANKRECRESLKKAPRMGCKILAGGCRAATTPGKDVNESEHPGGVLEEVGIDSFVNPIRPRCSAVPPWTVAATPPGSRAFSWAATGGVAALNPRLIAPTPPG